MFDDIQEARDALEIAQSAADRHGVPFYVVAHQVVTGKNLLRVSSVATHDYLEKISPSAVIPLA